MGPPSLPYAGIGYLRRKSREGRTMSVGPVNNGQGFAHQGNLPGNEGNGETQAPRGDGPRNDRAKGNNGNGNHQDGVHGHNDNGPITGGNNPALVDGGNQGNQGKRAYTRDHGTNETNGHPRAPAQDTKRGAKG